MVFSLGLSPVYALAAEMTVASAPPARSGAASGLLGTTANLGGALGIAFLGSLGGADLSPRHRRAGRCGTGELTASARDAFTLAFTTVELVGAGIMAALAVASALLLRPRPRSSSSRHARSPATPRSRR